MDEKEKKIESAESASPAEDAAPAAAQSENERDQELFDAIARKKARKKRRKWIITVGVVAVVALGIVLGVKAGRNKVRQSFGSMTSQVQSYVAGQGSLTSTVSGNGTLAYVDMEKLTAPKGVELEEILVSVGDRVTKGQLLATVETSSVMSLLTETQKEISALDGKLLNASYDTVSAVVNAPSNGRVKAVFAEVGTDVATCMSENGTLALISLDGKMVCSVPGEELERGAAVTVVRADGKGLPGTVESVVNGMASVLVTDDGPELGETVTVRSAEGVELGAAELAIHSELRVTGYAGTVSRVNAVVNRLVYTGNNLFSLTDTAYSANYEAVLRERREKEETLLQLLSMFRSGGVEAPFDGVVETVLYKVKTDTAQDPNNMYGFNGYGDYGSGGQQNQDTAKETALMNLAPEGKISVRMNVDETDILSLEVGQDAQVTVHSLGGAVFPGVVTEVHRTATSNDYGYVSYEAVVTLDKDPAMLAGMSANVLVRISGVDNTIYVPEQAVQQNREYTYVYTTHDETTGKLGGETAVTVGLSNNGLVEIIDGLSAGDIVYYEISMMDFYMFGTGGDAFASGGNGWVDMYASDGNASDGDAYYEELPAEENFAPAAGAVMMPPPPGAHEITVGVAGG